MHVVILDGTNPATAASVFSQAREWKTGNITNPSYLCKTLDWSTPGFLRIQPEPLPAALHQAGAPAPKELWLAVPLILTIALYQDDPTPLMPAPKAMH